MFINDQRTIQHCPANEIMAFNYLTISYSKKDTHHQQAVIDVASNGASIIASVVEIHAVIKPKFMANPSQACGQCVQRLRSG